MKGRQPSVSSVRVLPPAAIKLLSKPGEKDRTSSSADQLPPIVNIFFFISTHSFSLEGESWR